MHVAVKAGLGVVGGYLGAGVLVAITNALLAADGSPRRWKGWTVERHSQPTLPTFTQAGSGNSVYPDDPAPLVALEALVLWPLVAFRWYRPTYALPMSDADAKAAAAANVAQVEGDSSAQ